MDIFGFSTLVGGLALFLYGMQLMGEGLIGMAGGRLERLLQKMAGSPGRAVLAGAGVTAVMQSSSAVTVTVVGLADAGMVRLDQAAGIIMGANIGTTVTAWITGLSGINSPSILLRMLSPVFFSPFLAAAGVTYLIFFRRGRFRKASFVLVGFAILMFGMDTMTRAMGPLASSPGITAVLTCFSHPVQGVAAGMALTVLIQSSSASLGMLQALCTTGAVSYEMAIPMILGQNIGTCVTAVLSGIGAGKNARCTALVHLYFNVIGTVLFMGIFYGVNALKPLPFLGRSADGFGIALVHSVFNITATMLMLPFSDALIWLAVRTVGRRERTVRDPRFSLRQKFPL